MRKIVWFSDIHLGLRTSDIDRTEEIVQVSLKPIKHAVKLKQKGFDVIVVVGGDVFDHNDPSDHQISQFIRILNPAVKEGIKVYVLAGNHDSISNPSRKSCLQFLKKMKGGYECVKVVDDIKCIKWFTGDIGHHYLTFFPHITKAHIEGTKFKSTQAYIDYHADRIWNKVGQGQHQTVFSHLNVRGLIPGSEENLLKRSEVWFPESMMVEREDNGLVPPTVIQGHIHTKQKEKNMHVVGSPIFCDFGEKEHNKFFAVINVPETFGEKDKVIYKRTDCRPFIEVDVDVKPGVPVSKREQEIIDENAKLIDGNPSAVLKLNVTIPESEVGKCDWEKIRKLFAERVHYVKPIVPRVIRGRVVRNERQTIDLDPKKASKVWLKRHRPKGWKRKLRLAKTYIDVL